MHSPYLSSPLQFSCFPLLHSVCKYTFGKVYLQSCVTCVHTCLCVCVIADVNSSSTCEDGDEAERLRGCVSELEDCLQTVLSHVLEVEMKAAYDELWLEVKLCRQWRTDIHLVQCMSHCKYGTCTISFICCLCSSLSSSDSLQETALDSSRYIALHEKALDRCVWANRPTQEAGDGFVSHQFLQVRYWVPCISTDFCWAQLSLFFPPQIKQVSFQDYQD